MVEAPLVRLRRPSARDSEGMNLINVALDTCAEASVMNKDLFDTSFRDTDAVVSYTSLRNKALQAAMRPQWQFFYYNLNCHNPKHILRKIHKSGFVHPSSFDWSLHQYFAGSVVGGLAGLRPLARRRRLTRSVAYLRALCSLESCAES